MRVPSPLSMSAALPIMLTSVVLIVAIILSVTNVTIANAQQQPLTNQPTATQNRTELFQNAEDGIRLNVPQGWQIQDLNNTGPVFAEESTRGYGILAQLCLSEEEQPQQQRTTTANASSNSSSTINGCQAAQEEVIHIVRYPNLDSVIPQANNVTTTPAIGASFNNRTTTATSSTTTSTEEEEITIDNTLAYHLQKLQQVGYNNIQIINNVNTRVNLTMAEADQTVTTLPAKFAEITYTTGSSAPDEIKRGYFILTAANATSPNLGITKGYSVFYEGSTIAAAAEARSSGSLVSTPLPEPVRQVFDSFELITRVTSAEPLAVDINSRIIEGEDVAPFTFEFEAEVTGGTEPYTYSWEFGGEESAESNEQVVLHTFDDAGSYNVELTVTDSGGQSASDSIEITVEEEQSPQAEEDSEDVGSAVEDFIDDLFDSLGLR
jgi:PKD repeat protein